MSASDDDSRLSRLTTRIADGDRRAFSPAVSQAIELWGRDDGSVDDLLDRVAASAARSEGLSAELLLSLTHQLGLARPGIRRVVLDSDEVDEIAQNVLARVEQKIDRFDGRSRFRTWLFSVSRNEARMHVRRSARHPATVGTDAADEVVRNGARLSSVVATRTTVESAIERLPEHYRRTLELQLYQQLPLDQIAAVLDLPVGTVKSRLAKARKLLHDELGLR